MTQPTDPLYEHFGDMIPKQLQPTDAQGEDELDALLLAARTDEYGDSGNYNEAKLKQLIQAELTKQRGQAYKEGYNKRGEIVMMGLPAVKRQAREQARQELLDELDKKVVGIGGVHAPALTVDRLVSFIAAHRTAPTEEDKKTKENL